MSAPADHDSLHESSPENVMSRIAEQILRNGDARNGKKTKRLFISPLARRVARDRGIDLAALEGSGPHGRIVLADVERAASEPLTAGPEAEISQAPDTVAEPEPVMMGELMHAPAAVPVQGLSDKQILAPTSPAATRWCRTIRCAVSSPTG